LEGGHVGAVGDRGPWRRLDGAPRIDLSVSVVVAALAATWGQEGGGRSNPTMQTPLSSGARSRQWKNVARPPPPVASQR